MIASGGSYYNVASGCIDSAGLPSEYQQVEYIENSGTQYINTNYIPNFENGFEISVEYTPENSSSRGCLLSNYCATPYHISLEVRESFRQRFYYHNGTWDNNILGVKILNKRNIGIFKYINGVFYHTLNDTTQSYDYTSPGSCNEPLLMFVDTNKRFATFTNYLKIYKCIIKESNTLVRNFIPCYRISDNEIGMYDTVNDVFYTNQGTGTFVKGPNVYNRYTIKEFDRPYISGHVTDGSSTFTFYVNEDQLIDVPVDSNGNWKWMVDRIITSLHYTFQSKQTIDYVKINYKKNAIDGRNVFYQNTGIRTIISNAPISVARSFVAKNYTEGGVLYVEVVIDSTCTDCGYFARGQSELKELIIKGDTSNVTDYEYLLRMCTSLETLKIPTITTGTNINSTYALTEATNLENLQIDHVFMNVSWKNQSKLTKQSIINLVNAAEANITYTLHATPYAKCASGGEWYTDVQAAINAKAQQGYTVTLISA